MKSEWLCVTEVLLYPLNSETETHTLVNIQNRPLATTSPIITFKVVVFCVNPPLKSHRSGTLKHEKQQTQVFNRQAHTPIPDSKSV